MKIQSMEQSLSGLRSDNIQLETQTTVVKNTQVVDVYSRDEIQRLEVDVKSLENKNRRLRDILAQIGIKTTKVSTGKIKTEEIRECDHFQSTMRIGLEQQTQ